MNQINFQLLTFLIFLMIHHCVSSVYSTFLDIRLASEESQFVCNYPRSAVNISYVLPSHVNLSRSLELCADEDYPFLFVQNATILGCGMLMHPGSNSTHAVIGNDTANNSRVLSSTTFGNGESSTLRQDEILRRTSIVTSYTSSLLSTMITSGGIVNLTHRKTNINSKLQSFPLENNTLSNGLLATRTVNPPDSMLTSVESLQTMTGTQSYFSSNYSSNPTTTSSIINGNSIFHSSQSLSNLFTSNINNDNSLTVTIQPSRILLPSLTVSRAPESNQSHSSMTIQESNDTIQCDNSSCATGKQQNSTVPLRGYNTEMFKEISLNVLDMVHFTTRPPNICNVSINCSFMPGDKTPVLYGEYNSPLSVSFSHRYLIPGRFRARIYCTCNKIVVVDVSRRVDVISHLTSSVWDCPRLYHTNTTYNCSVYIDQAGSDLDLWIKAGDNPEITRALPGMSTSTQYQTCQIFGQSGTNNKCGSKLSRAGALGMTIKMFPETTAVVTYSVPRNSSANNIPLHSFCTVNKTFSLKSVEFESKIVGTIMLKILRPRVTLEMSWEPVGNVSCASTDYNMNISSPNNVSICVKYFVHILNHPSDVLGRSGYNVVHNVTLNAYRGRNFVSLPNADVFKTHPGDVIGYTIYQSESKSSSSNMTSTSSPSSNTTVLSTVPSHSNQNSNPEDIVKFYLYGFEAYETRIVMRFVNPGIVPLRVAIRNKNTGSVVTQYKTIAIVQNAVSGLKFNYTAIIPLNTPRYIGFELSRGTNASCDWSLTGRMENMRHNCSYRTQNDPSEKLQTMFLYHHNNSDDMTFLVNCSNSVSTISRNVTISVRRKVSELVASLYSASFAYTHAQTHWRASALGDHVGFKWIIDNKGYIGADVNMAFSSGKIPCSETLVNVYASNVISREAVNISVKVLENPLTIQLFPSTIVSSNENITITPILNWSPFLNASLFYSEYGVNITDALRNFVAFPSFKITIDEKLKFDNVLNGSAQKYKFEAVGSKSKKSKIYVEALNHPEMNRVSKITVMDPVTNLRITSCPTIVTNGEVYSFDYTSDGSNVSGRIWTVTSSDMNKTSNSNIKFVYQFVSLGVHVISVAVHNQISSRNTSCNVSVVPKPSSEIVFETFPPSGQYVTASKSSQYSVGSLEEDMSLVTKVVFSTETGPLSQSNRLTETTSYHDRVTSTSLLLTQSSVLMTSFTGSPKSSPLSSHNTAVMPSANHSSGIIQLSPTINDLDGVTSTFISEKTIMLSSPSNSRNFSSISSDITTTQPQSDSSSQIVTALNNSFKISGFRAYVFTERFNKRINVLLGVISGTGVLYSVNYDDGTVASVGNISNLGENISLYHNFKDHGYYNVSVTVTNQYGPNSTKYFHIYIDEICQLESAILFGISQDSNEPSQFREKDVILVALKTTLNCSIEHQLQYSWKIFNIDGAHFKLNYTSNGNAFHFPANILNASMYKVQVTVEIPGNSSVITRFGYLRRITELLDVQIECGSSRVVSAQESVTIKASVISDSENVIFHWFCDVMMNVACFGTDVPDNSSQLRLPRNYFAAGTSYNFVVKASDGHLEGTARQKVTFAADNSTLGLCLSLANRRKILLTKDTEIVPHCAKCSHVLDLKWLWKVVKIITIKNWTREYVVDNLTLDSSKLLIPAGLLRSNTLYRIELNVTSSQLNISDVSSFELKTNDLPSGGFCDVKPYDDVSALNAFQTSCYAWYDRNQPLTYEYWYSIDGQSYHLFYAGQSSKSGTTYFRRGLSQANFVITVRIVIIDSLGESTSLLLYEKSTPPSDSEIEAFFNSSNQVDILVEEMLKISNIQGALQYLKSVSSLLDETVNMTYGNEKRVEMRGRIMSNLKRLCCFDDVTMKQSIDVITSASIVSSELNVDAQSHAFGVLQLLIQNFTLLSTRKEMINVSKDIAMALSLLMSASSLIDGDDVSQNNSQLSKINAASLQTLESLADILVQLSKADEPAITLITTLFTIAVQKHVTEKFPGTRVSIADQLTEFVVPRKLGNISGPYVSTKMIWMQNNLLLSGNTSITSPNTGVASLVLLNDEGAEQRMKDLIEPFFITLKNSDTTMTLSESSFQTSTIPPSISNARTLPTTVVLEIAEDNPLLPTSPNIHRSSLTEDSLPDLYEVNTTKGTSALLISILQMSADNKGELRMRLHNDKDSNPIKSEFSILTTSSLPVSYVWRGLREREQYYIRINYKSQSFRKAGKANSVGYTVSFRELGCYYWNTSHGQWKQNGCEVGEHSTSFVTQCECNHLTWFGATVFIPPNTISLRKVSQLIQDPQNYVTILSVLSSIFLVYCLFLVWARRCDLKDNGKNGITWCPTNHVTDSHRYHVIIHTGIRQNAGTTANVGLMLSGELGKSRKCLLKSTKRKVLKRGSVDSFVVTTAKKLGSIDYLYIWHDNSGNDPAWFLNRVVVIDLDTHATTNFLCYRWLAVDEGDGEIQRLLPIADSEDLRRFRHLFVSRATSELTDAHLWFSVAFRPVSSPFSRMQRVSCCLNLLLTSMMVNAMWYKTEETGKSSEVNLGLFSFSWNTVFIGICSNLIVFPVNLLLVQIFRNCRSKSSVSVRCSQPSASSKMRDARDQTRGVTSGVMHRKLSDIADAQSARSLTSLIRDEESSSEGKNPLPHWCCYVGWFGVTVSCVVSTAVTFLYAVQFGEQKTQQWLLSLTISLVNDIFVAQPTKVLTVTLVLAYIFKRPLKERYLDVVQHEMCESSSSGENELKAPDFTMCSAGEFLRAAREKRSKDKVMYSLLKSVFSHLLFTVIVLIMAYGQRDVNGYYLTNTQKNTFVDQSYKGKSLKGQSYTFYQVITIVNIAIVSSGYLHWINKILLHGYENSLELTERFSINKVLFNVGEFNNFNNFKVANVKDFWRWSETVLFPGISNNDWFNYTAKWSDFTANFGGFLFGAATMRQKRLKKDVCVVIPVFKKIIQSCSGTYAWSKEDEKSYNISWRNLRGKLSLCNDRRGDSLNFEEWCYSRPNGFINAPFVGRLATYSKGGYSKYFDQNGSASLNRSRDLKTYRWIDKYTRAVFVEFSVYNPNVNLFSILTFVFEIAASGDFNPDKSFLSIRLYNYVGSFEIFFVICQLIFLAFVCVYTYHSVRRILRERCSFFVQSWSVYELIIVVLSWLAVALYFVSIKYRQGVLDEFRQDPTKYVSFRPSASWQMSLEYATAALVFMTTLKFLRLFQFNRRMFLLSVTLSDTVYELFSCTVVFSVILVAFSMLYYLMLHAYNSNFFSIITTIQTLLHVLLGKSDVLVKRHQFPVLERLVLFIYMCLMKFILLNIFVVILNDGFTRARAKIQHERNTFEFVDFLRKLLYDLVGIRQLHVGNTDTIRYVKKKQKRVRFKNVISDVEYSLMKLEDKMEKLLNLVYSDSFREIYYYED